jgi:hypothetical protein
VYVSEQGFGLKTTLILFQPGTEHRNEVAPDAHTAQCGEISKEQVQMNAN